MKYQILLFALLVVTRTAIGAEPPETTAIPLVLDVRTACPGIDGALQKSLSSAWGRVQKPATMRMQFRLDGGRGTEVQMTGMNLYRPFVRRAVRQLNCRSSETAEEVAFILDIVDPDQFGGQERVVIPSRSE